MIQKLPVKFDRPTKMTDNYVWTPDCSLNIKLREGDLKNQRAKKLQILPHGRYLSQHHIRRTMDNRNLQLSNFYVSYEKNRKGIEYK